MKNSFINISDCKNKRKILINGAACSLEAVWTIRFLWNGEWVIGSDNLNYYYDVNLKKSRLTEITKISKKSNRKWYFYKQSVEN